MDAAAAHAFMRLQQAKTDEERASIMVAMGWTPVGMRYRNLATANATVSGVSKKSSAISKKSSVKKPEVQTARKRTRHDESPAPQKRKKVRKKGSKMTKVELVERAMKKLTPEQREAFVQVMKDRDKTSATSAGAGMTAQEARKHDLDVRMGIISPDKQGVISTAYRQVFGTTPAALARKNVR